MIAIIPARGGSKGLPGKNIKELCGKPLIGYAIESALGSRYIDRVIVSTDDEKIAEVSKEYGAEVPFMRPEYLASDTSSAIDVYIHAIEYLTEHDEINIKNFMVLLPTAPFRTSRHIDGAVEIFNREHAETLISVTEAEAPPGWYLVKDIYDRIQNAGFDNNKSLVSNRQVNQQYYIPNGAIYILDKKLIETKRTYYSDNTVPYIMNRLESVDIDTIDDFIYAEFLMSKRSR